MSKPKMAQVKSPERILGPLLAKSDHFAREYPSLAGAFARIGDWARAHQNVSRIVVRDLSRELSDVDAWLLGEALDILIRRGILAQAYLVKAPSGVESVRVFNDPTEIPTEVPDKLNNYFSTANADILTLLTPANL